LSPCDAIEFCIVAVVGLLARPPNISPRRSTPGRSSAGGDEEVDESAIILRSTLNALVRLAATASDPSAALLDEPMALPALAEALTTSESGSGSTATATRPFDTEVRSAMLQVLADALVSSAGEGSGGSFGGPSSNSLYIQLDNNISKEEEIVSNISTASIKEVCKGFLQENMIVKSTIIKTSKNVCVITNVPKGKYDSLLSLQKPIYNNYSITITPFTKKKNEIIFIKYNNLELKYMYICANCKSSWKN
jgi:hypothetical protein